MALGRGRVGEAERGRRGHDDRDAVGHQRVISPVAARDVLADEPRDWIAERVRNVHAGVAEADTRIVGRQRQVQARLEVEPVEHRAAQVLADVLDGLLAPDVAGRVGADVRGAIGWMVLGPRVVWARRVRLDRVRQDVGARRGRHFRRRGERVERIDDAEGRTEQPVRDTSLHVVIEHVSHRDRGRLAAGSRRRRHRDQGLERARHCPAPPHRLVHVVEQWGRKRRQQIHRLARIECAAAADRDEPVELALTRVLGGLLHRPVGGLDLDAVVDIRLDPFLFEKRADAVGQPELADAPVGHDQHALEPEPSSVVRDLVGSAEPELDRRGFHHEHGFGR